MEERRDGYHEDVRWGMLAVGCKSNHVFSLVKTAGCCFQGLRFQSGIMAYYPCPSSGNCVIPSGFLELARRLKIQNPGRNEAITKGATWIKSGMEYQEQLHVESSDFLLLNK